ncbi:hypothetical protein [Brachyspira alvinipulli]|uniref:hypothetical protein n=1 Tax=Brachyspira alvinipulli TaxID=84379 RepID=UPI0004AE1EF3|nr:hypothetical protein [Brachyspira alvinipulli]
MLNENNIQAPFKYKISENTFELDTIKGELELNKNNVQVKIFEGQRLFCADIGYAVDGALEEMEFLIDDIKVYPVLLEQLENLKSVDVKDNEIYLVKNDINFKSIIFFPSADLNKNFKYTITTYSSTFSAFMFDEIAKKLNVIDVNAPIKNFYEDTDYKINDIIKYNGYLYRVFKDFTSDDTDYYLINNCNLITPFKKIELNTEYKINDLVEYNNNFFTVQSDFTYEEATNLNDVLKPIEEIIEWNDNIKKVYKNQIILKDDFCYLVLVTSENYTFDELLQFQKINYLNKASNTFYDDTNSGFGNNTNTVQKAIEKLKSDKQGSLTAGNNIDLNGNKIIFISKTDNTDFDTGSTYNITLTIKNRQFHSIDTYFVGAGENFATNYLSYLNLQNNNGFVKLVGTLTGTGTDSSATTSLCSFIATLNDYFNLVSTGSYVNTTQITSSTGKAVKYYFMLNASYKNAVDLVIAYQDGSTINTDDVFTLNLTPDKNSTVDLTTAAVTNVQQLGEALTERLDKLDIIADGEEHPTGTYYYNADSGKKPIYYRAFEKQFQKNEILNTDSNEWEIDMLLYMNGTLY